MSDSIIGSELGKLIQLGQNIYYLAAYKENDDQLDEDTEKYFKGMLKEIPDFKQTFQVWYSRAYRSIRTLAPERLDEFEEFYKGQKNIKQLDFFSAGMTHYLQGLITRIGLEKQNYYGKFASGLEAQINILTAINENLDDALYNLETEMQYGFLKSELEVAKELKKIKQLRASGAICGVVIESHLKTVCEFREIKFRKKNPAISDYNDALKKKEIIDTIVWRHITRCGDIRNLCVHAKERDPTPDEIDDIIRGAEKVIAEVA